MFVDSSSFVRNCWTSFTHLDKTKISSWEDLVNAFISQYKFNIEVSPDRFDLQKESIKPGESFHDYAQRWRAEAAQVQPSLSEKELISTFLSTLTSLFYEHLIGTATTDFATFIQIGQRIEDGIKTENVLDYSKFHFPIK